MVMLPPAMVRLAPPDVATWIVLAAASSTGACALAPRSAPRDWMRTRSACAWMSSVSLPATTSSAVGAAAAPSTTDASTPIACPA
ncbi:hypothetical protein G6F62_015339 [Rhizopus arrhizus]|nr:hypothetical protein G6F62_015339 [Rhizopus arrhizus]